MRKLALGALSLSVCATFVVGGAAEAGSPPDPVGGEHKLGVRGGLKYVSESLKIGSSGHFDEPYEAAYVACGPHSSSWKPASGGASIKGAASDAFIASLRPMDLSATWESPDDAKPDDWWESTVFGVVGRRMTGYTICTKKPLRYLRDEVPDGSSSDRTASTSCPAHFQLVGGGSFIATSGSFVNSSYPGKNNTWHTRILDTVGGLGGMESYAVCSKAAVGSVVRSVKGIAHGHAATATAMCPASLHVIGGGGRWTGAIADAQLAASRPVDGPDRDKVPDDGWKVVGYNAAGTKKALTSFARCVTHG